MLNAILPGPGRNWSTVPLAMGEDGQEDGHIGFLHPADDGPIERSSWRLPRQIVPLDADRKIVEEWLATLDSRPSRARLDRQPHLLLRPAGDGSWTVTAFERAGSVQREHSFAYDGQRGLRRLPRDVGQREEKVCPPLPAPADAGMPP